MMKLKDERWVARLSNIDFAFQPIVNIHTGAAYGYEVLLRNYKDAGFNSIYDFFDKAYEDLLLYPVDLKLREKAIEKFSKLEWNRHTKLFINLDNRLLDSKDYMPGNTVAILKEYNLSQDALCFEISERHEINNHQEVDKILNTYRSQGFKIGVDDFGTGFAGLKLLYYTKPDFIKIDRFFIQDITHDPNKRLVVSSIVNIAHLMGGIVIAEGIETEEEYYSCRNIGCDLVQGYLIQKPELNIDKIYRNYDHIRTLNDKDKRKERSEDKRLIAMKMEHIEPVLSNCEILDVFEKFKNGKKISFLPVVNENNEPLGIISENSLKNYAYSRYGSQLLQNPAFGKNLNKFITKFPIADIYTPVEKILEIYSQNENLEGILIVDSMKYRGFLSAHSLLNVLNEKNVAVAREQNPLTRLPGNMLINEYISNALHDIDSKYFFVYFDFDNFKPYNDKYGFRNGDRVILLFSDLLRANILYTNHFIAHIGGDDFFMGIQGGFLEKVHLDIIKLSKQFQSDVESFYDPETLQKRYIVSKDREGKIKTFPLLTVSTVIIELSSPRSRIYSTEEISNFMAQNKKTAKNCAEKVCIGCI